MAFIEPCFGIGHNLSLICQMTSEDIKHQLIMVRLFVLHGRTRPSWSWSSVADTSRLSGLNSLGTDIWGRSVESGESIHLDIAFFPYAAPSVWSSLPREIRHTQSTTAFKTAPKTHLFKNTTASKLSASSP